MNPKLRTIDILILMAALLYACTPSLADGLSDTKWILKGLHSDGTSLAVNTPNPVTLEIGEDGSIGGSAGCNSYFGSADFKAGGSLTISEVGSSEMYCTEGMDVETAYLAALIKADACSLEGDTLTLTAGGGSLRLEFYRSND